MNLNRSFCMMSYQQKSKEDTKYYYQKEKDCHSHKDLREETHLPNKSAQIIHQPPDICYPEFKNLRKKQCHKSKKWKEKKFKNFNDRSAFKVHAELANNLNSINLCSSLTNSEGLDAVPLTDMEETFRSALLQYFSQIDREKEGLTGDLRQIKDDFNKYVAEGKRYKAENAQQKKIIQKLTENGKLLVQEIERLKIALQHDETQKCRLLKENVELRKKVQYEDEIIPQLESEMKSLADENNYLKLLAEDTKQLEQQENQIRHYVHQVEQQQKTNEKYVKELHKQTHIISTISSANEKLGVEMQKFEECKKENETLKLKEKKLGELTKLHQCQLQENKTLKNEIDCLHSTINELQKEMNDLRVTSSNLSKKYTAERETVKEKGQNLVEINAKVKDLKQLHITDTESLKKQEHKIRELSDEIQVLKNGNNTILSEMKAVKMKNETFICEEEIRSHDYKNMIKKLETLEYSCNMLSKKEREKEKELHEKNEHVNELKTISMHHENTVRELKVEIEEKNENLNQTNEKFAQLKIREGELEEEILSGVKKASEMEQSNILMSKTIESLGKSNDSCINQRAGLQKNILTLQLENNTLTEVIESSKESVKSITDKLKVSNEKYGICDEQRTRLQKEILLMQDKVNKTEFKLNEFNKVKDHLDETKQSLNQSKIQNDHIQGELLFIKNQNDLLEEDLKRFEKVKNMAKDFENEVLDLKHQLLLSQQSQKLHENEALGNKLFKERLEIENSQLNEDIDDLKNQSRILENTIQEYKVQFPSNLQNTSKLCNDVAVGEVTQEQTPVNCSFNEKPNSYLIEQNRTLKLEVEDIKNEKLDLLNIIENIQNSKAHQTCDCTHGNLQNLNNENDLQAKQTEQNISDINELQNKNKELEQFIITSDETYNNTLEENKKLKVQLKKCQREKNNLKKIVDHYYDSRYKNKIKDCECNLKTTLSDSKHEVSNTSNDLIQFDTFDSTLNNISKIEFDSADTTVINATSNFTEDGKLAAENSESQLKQNDDNIRKLKSESLYKIKGELFASEIKNGAATSFSAEQHSFLCSSDVVEHNVFELNLNESKPRPLITNNTYENKTDSQNTSKQEKYIQTLDTDSKQLYEYIYNLEMENKNLQEDIDNIIKDYQILKTNFENIEKHLQLKENDIEELIDTLSLKNDNIKDLEGFINKNQAEFNQHQINKLASSKETDEFKEDFKKILNEKSFRIADLEIHCADLQQTLNNKHNEIASLLRQLEHHKFLHSQNIRDINLLDEQKEDHPLKLPNPNETLVERYKNEKPAPLITPVPPIEELPKPPNCTKDISTTVTKEVSCFEEDQPQAKKRNLNDVINTSADEETVTVADFLLIKSELEKKDQLITDLEQHIKLLEKLTNEQTVNQVKKPMEKSKKKQVQFHLNLQLPEPNKNNKSEKRKPKILPSLPPNKSNRNKNSSKSKTSASVISPGEVNSPMASINDVFSSPEELRRKLVKLNSEFLQKKIVVNKLEDELKISKRKKERAEESYRNVVEKNESLEHEILDNRRKIREIQARQQANELSDKERQRHISEQKLSIESLERKCHTLASQNNKLISEINEKEKSLQKHRDISDTLEFENNHIKGSSEVLTQEMQRLMNNKTQYQTEISSLKEDISNLEATVKHLTYENNMLKENTEATVTNFKELSQDHEDIHQNVIQLNDENEKLKMSLSICENEKHIFEIEINEKERIIKDMEEHIYQCNEEKTCLRQQNNKLESLIGGGDEAKRDLVSEKEVLDRNTKYLETKVTELKENLFQKEEKIFAMKKEQGLNTENANKYEVELNFKTKELQNIEDQLKMEINKYEKLEQLSDEMNNENKKLMHEVLLLKDNLSTAAIDSKKDREKLIRYEKEQSDLDNIVLKTQKSNNGLLDNNEMLNKENRKLRKSIDHVARQLDVKESELHKLTRKLEVTEEDLSVANKCLIDENKRLKEELSVARNTVNEFESILDQGQMDFNELESQLECYRKENIALDQKLHEILKTEMKLKCENEEYAKRVESLQAEIFSSRQHNDKLNHVLRSTNVTNDEIKSKNQEYKTRDDYFEERLKGYESILQTKDEMIQNDKKEKEKLQTTVLSLQSELIEIKNVNEKLSREKEIKSKDISLKLSQIETLEKSSLNQSNENEDLSSQLTGKSKQLQEAEYNLKTVKTERDGFESELRKTNSQLMIMENKVQNEQLKYHQEKEEFLIEISTLKRRMTECNVDVEKQNYKQQSQENEIHQIRGLNEKLENEMKTKEERYNKEKQEMIETMNKIRVQFQLDDQEKQHHIAQLRGTIETMDDSKAQDVSLIQLKLKEVEELRKMINREQNISNQKENEIESLKEDIMQIQTDIEIMEVENEELKNKNQETNSKVMTLEKENHSNQLEIRRLTNANTKKEEQIETFTKEQHHEKLDKMTMKTEKEKLERSFDIVSEEKDIEKHKYETEIRLLKQQLITFEIVKDENAKLQLDIDAFLNERRGYQGKTSELTQLRSENFELRSRFERAQEQINENRVLRQDLLDKELRYREVTEKFTRENATLKRQNDELFKQNQELELRNANIVRTRPKNSFYFETGQRIDPVTSALRQKSRSQENITDIGLDGENFSPTRNAVATSTPTQESSRFISSIVITKQQSEPKVLSSFEHANNTNDVKHVLSSSKPMLVEQEELSQEKQTDAQYGSGSSNWNRANEDVRSSIKMNPFLQMDKSKANVTSKAFSKVTTSGGSTPISNNPKKSFDIRPKSNEITLDTVEQVKQTANKPSGVGNEFVSRLKAAFETK